MALSGLIALSNLQIIFFAETGFPYPVSVLQKYFAGIHYSVQ